MLITVAIWGSVREWWVFRPQHRAEREYRQAAETRASESERERDRYRDMLRDQIDKFSGVLAEVAAASKSDAHQMGIMVENFHRLERTVSEMNSDLHNALDELERERRQLKRERAENE